MRVNFKLRLNWSPCRRHKYILDLASALPALPFHSLAYHSLLAPQSKIHSLLVFLAPISSLPAFALAMLPTVALRGGRELNRLQGLAGARRAKQRIGVCKKNKQLLFLAPQPKVRLLGSGEARRGAKR